MKKQVMSLKISDLCEAIPYLFNIKLFFDIFDELEEEIPTYVDPRKERVIKLLIAGQFKRMEKQSTFKQQCIYSFFNNISKKVNPTNRLPFPQNKE